MKGLLSRIYKELSTLNKKADNASIVLAKDLNRHFIQEDIKMADRHMKICSTSLHNRKMLIKIMTRYHYMPTAVTKIRKMNHANIARM